MLARTPRRCGHFPLEANLRKRKLQRRISPQRYGRFGRSYQHLAGNFALFLLVGTLTALLSVFVPEMVGEVRFPL